MVFRTSFRQLLLLAFVLVSLVLGAVSLRGLQAMQGLLAQSRDAAHQNVQLNLSIRGLAERSTDMERAARQYLVLKDTALRQRFEDAADQAERLLPPLEINPATTALTAQWRSAVAQVREQLQRAPAQPNASMAALTAEFDQLGELVRNFTEQVQQSVAQRSQQMQDALETQRTRQVQQVLVSIGTAAAAAVLFGLWLTRPLRTLGQAILALGQGQLKQAIHIRGPSDLAQLGRQLDWLRLRLTELDEDKARFLRHTSHELKTPLAALREGIALLQEGVGGALAPKQGEIVAILRHNATVLQQQIEDLLRYNAAAFDARNLRRHPTVLHGLITQVVQSQHLSWQARQLQVEITGNPQLACPVDAERLGMALSNLHSNATRFSPLGGRITWWIGEQDNSAVVRICDQGPGIPKAERSRIFDPFFRGSVQPLDQPRGSGIGLAIVREQVMAHGGQVRLSLPRSESGSGACFEILLPMNTSYV